MASVKRKWEELEESDEESPSYGRQILPVANLPDDFNEEPMDGLQYLFMVRRNARQLPGTVRVANPYEKPEVAIPGESLTEPCLNQSLLPSEEWRETFDYRFQNFRKNFNQPTIHIGKTSIGPRRQMPDRKDRDLWWDFLSGRPETEWNPTKKSKSKSKSKPLGQKMRAWTNADVSAGKKESPSPFVYNSWQQTHDEGEVERVLMVNPAETFPSPAGTPVPLDYIEGLAQPSSSVTEPPLAPPEITLVPREPTTELLKSIDEPAALHLLMYFTHWINLYIKSPESSPYLPTDCHARWIFSLLSRVGQYVSADDMSLLRNLARACLGLLKYIMHQKTASSWTPGSSTSRKMGESSCWIITTTIAGTWKQRDLWSTAEDTIRQLRS